VVHLAVNINVKRPPLEGLVIVPREESSPMIRGRVSVSYLTCEKFTQKFIQ